MEYIVGAFIPIPNNLSKKIIRTEKKLAFYYNYKSTPHITLYLARYYKRNFDKFLNGLKLEKLHSFPISLEAPTIVNNKLKGNKFIFVKIKKHGALHDLHKKVLEVGNKFRDGLIRTKEQRRIKDGLYSKKELDYLNRYGYTRVLSFFRPHISIGETSTKDLPKLHAELRKNLDIKPSDKFVMRELIVGIYERDLRGVYKKIIAEKKIKLS